MSSRKQIHIVHAGESRTVLAKINGKLYSDKYITWKKQTFNEDDVKKNPYRHLFAIEDKGEILSFSKNLVLVISFSKKDVGKYIKIHAHVDEFSLLRQSTVFYVEDTHKTDVRVKEVKRVDSDKKNIYVGDKIKLKVNYSVAETKVSNATKKNVKWMVCVGSEKEERLTVDGIVIKGGEIEFMAPEAWANKNIIFMPFLNKHTKEVSITQFCKKHFDVKILAEYIQEEMVTNMNSQECLTIKKYNYDFWYGSPLDIIKNKKMAYRLWKDLVAAGKIWDHKAEIFDDYGEWSCNKDKTKPLKYGFDIWSNIHYGFVGKHAGFLELELLNGAGYAQIGDNNKSLKSWETWKEYLKSRTVDLGDADFLGGFDDPKDQQAIKIGFRLYDNHKDALTIEHIIDELNSVYEKKKPINILECEEH